MAKLVVVTKGLAVSAHELGENWVTIGRADGNAFQIIEASVSGRHCEVHLQGNELLVRDLQSTNGTFIGGQKVSESILKAGGIMKLGEVEIRFEVPSPAASSGSGIKKPAIAVSPVNPPATPAPIKTTPVIAAKPVAAPVPAPAAAAVPAAVPAPAPTPAAAPDPVADAKKVQVLFVDDSMAFLEMITTTCGRLSNQAWATHFATSADRALAILKEQAMDLVVIDIGMPVLDGLQLLGLISRRYPGMKTAILTGQPSDGRRADALANGAELFIEKPVTEEGIKMAFNMLNDLVSWERREGFSGALRQVGLQEVIQMECHGRHSSVLEVRNKEMRGQIYIESGAIIHAAVGTLEGEKAFFKLLSLTGGEFQVRPFQAPPKRTVQCGWEVLLMEAARVSDEETAFTKKHPTPNAPAKAEEPKAATAKAETTAAPAPDSRDHELGDDIIVVATYDGKWTPVDGGPKK